MARELQQQTAAKQAELLAKSREHAQKLREQVARAVEEAGPPKN
jgi:pyrroline-5-carboxylate reductase